MYSDISGTRGLGPGVAAMTFTAVAIGSLIAAPLAGRLADRHCPATVAALSRAALALAVLALGFAGSAWTVWLAAAAVGAAVAVTQPAIQVMLLAWTAERHRRDVFAWQFIALNLGLAAGGFVGGFVVDLHSPGGARPIYVIAAVGAVVSAAAVHLAARGARPTTVDVSTGGGQEPGYRAILASPAIRWLLGVTVLLTLACYAQYESGLPAYALDTLHVSPQLLGTAVAVNAIMVAALTGPFVSATRRHSSTLLLGAAALIWLACWLVFGLPMVAGGLSSLAVLVGYGSFSFGETMLAPVLNPMAAALAPEGATGRTLAAVAGATTVATAVGPAVSGVLLALHLPSAFIALQVASCLAALVAARRLSVLTGTTATVGGFGAPSAGELDAVRAV